MLFKNELPTPRYTFDGDLEDDDIAIEKTYELQSHIPDLTGCEVLLIAPRCASLATSFSGSALGTVQLFANTKPKESRRLLNALVQDFYEVDANSEDFASTQQWTVPIRKGPKDLVVVSLPALGDAEASYLGRELIALLKPAKVFLATPGVSFMSSSICFFCTANFDPANLQDVPRAEPPVLVQSTGAAAVSRAQQQHIPALALVVSADGPANHEIVSSTGMSELRVALFKALNLKLVSEPQVERSISVLYF